MFAWPTPICVDCKALGQPTRYKKIALKEYRRGLRVQHVQSVTTILDDCNKLLNWLAELMFTAFDILNAV